MTHIYQSFWDIVNHSQLQICMSIKKRWFISREILHSSLTWNLHPDHLKCCFMFNVDVGPQAEVTWKVITQRMTHVSSVWTVVTSNYQYIVQDDVLRWRIFIFLFHLKLALPFKCWHMFNGNQLKLFHKIWHRYQQYGQMESTTNHM